MSALSPCPFGRDSLSWIGLQADQQFSRRLSYVGNVYCNAGRARSARIEIIGNPRIEHIGPITNSNRWWLRCCKERIVSRFEHFPKRRVRIVPVARQVLRCHSEWKGRQLNFVLAAFEGFVD